MSFFETFFDSHIGLLYICVLFLVLKNDDMNTERKNLLWLIFILFFTFIPSFAERLDLRFNPIGVNEGLAQNSIFSILQDHRNRLWCATFDGVSRFDGYNFRNYKHQENDSTSILSNETHCLYKDKSQRIWVGTKNGASRYNAQKDCFVNYPFSQKNNGDGAVHAFVEMSSKKMWVATNQGIFNLNVQTGVFTRVKNTESICKQRVFALLRVKKKIYIGTEKRLYVYNLVNGVLSFIQKVPESSQVKDLLMQSPTRLWIATEGNGLMRYNPVENTIVCYKYSKNKGCLNSNLVRSLGLDNQNRLWVGTYNGLNIYSESTDQFQLFTHQDWNKESLSQNSVRAIYRDNQGGMWLGTYYGGLNYYNKLRNRFSHIYHVPFKNSISDNKIGGIIEGEKHSLWIGTSGGGLNRYSTLNKTFEYFDLGGTLDNNTHASDIKGMYLDRRSHKLYIGSHNGGLTVLDTKTKRVKRFTHENSALIDNDVYVIEPCDEYRLWIGSLTSLSLFDMRTQEIKLIPKDVTGYKIGNLHITTLFKDASNRLWIGGKNGLRIYENSADKLVPFSLPLLTQTLSKTSINAVFQMHNKKIWLATGNGIYSLNERKKKLIHLGQKEGLPNNNIYGILEDSYGQLWLSSNKGIICFNQQSKTIYNYTVLDGLQSNQFSQYAACYSSEGVMYFGGINGINSFKPELMMDNPYAPRPRLSSLTVFNQLIRPGDESEILTEDINRAKKITLKHNQNTITLRFVVTNFIAGVQNTYMYRMKGLDDTWYKTTKNRSVSYANLAEGEYTFEIKAANNDDKWSKRTTSLAIKVLPVWYKTWWALFLFAVLLVLIIYAVMSYFLDKQKMKTQLLMERRDKEHREEVNQMKIRFFINISHELRTPLTLILGPLQDLMSKTTDRWVHEQLKYMDRNAKRLLHLVNQLMNYRRAELGMFELHVGEQNAYKRVLANFERYENLAEKSVIDFQLLSNCQEKELIFDENYLDLILNNLLSNAFKYTHLEDSITVEINEECLKGEALEKANVQCNHALEINDKVLVLKVSDTGVGIPVKKRTKIFDRFYQVDDKQVGSGIGLSLVLKLIHMHHGFITLESQENEGACFTVYLPQEQRFYSEAERTQIKTTESDYITRCEENSYNKTTLSSEDLASAMVEDLGRDKQQEGMHQLVDPEKHKSRILIVEDNEEVRNYISSGLKDVFEVYTASHGVEGLELLKHQEVDAIVTDVMMPIMDGLKFCKLVKQQLATCHIPVYMLSAKSEVKFQLEGLQVGADDYIEKPFSLAVLKNKIQNLLHTRYRNYAKYSHSLEVEPEKITRNTADEEFLCKAKETVLKHLDDSRFTTNEFAKVMSMSRSNLHIKLKNITGKSAIDFIYKIRFGKACELLKEGKYNVSEVCYMVGFNSPSYFATRFKKVVGCLPTEYSKNHP